MTRVSSYLLASIWFVSVASFLMHQGSEAQSSVALAISSSHPSLGFQSFKGKFTTDDQVQSFLNFINSASSFFQEDTKARLDYISQEMNETYGTRAYGFSVIQQTKEGINGIYHLAYTGIYAALAPGVDRRFPKYSYMFIMDPYVPFSARELLSEVGQKGTGISNRIEYSIVNIILSVQTGDTCKCEAQNLNAISEQIGAQNNGTWNVYCSSEPDIFIMNIYSIQSRYIFTKPKNCYYRLYDNDWRYYS